jgi:hypothetical protein
MLWLHLHVCQQLGLLHSQSKEARTLQFKVPYFLTRCKCYILCYITQLHLCSSGAINDSQKDLKAHIKGAWILNKLHNAFALLHCLRLSRAGAINDFQKDLQFRKLNAQKDVIEVKVVRGGNTCLVKNSDVVVGDLLVLDTGAAAVWHGLICDCFLCVLDTGAAAVLVCRIVRHNTVIGADMCGGGGGTNACLIKNSDVVVGDLLVLDTGAAAVWLQCGVHIIEAAQVMATCVTMGTAVHMQRNCLVGSCSARQCMLLLYAWRTPDSRRVATSKGGSVVRVRLLQLAAGRS